MNGCEIRPLFSLRGEFFEGSVLPSENPGPADSSRHTVRSANNQSTPSFPARRAPVSPPLSTHFDQRVRSRGPFGFICSNRFSRHFPWRRCSMQNAKRHGARVNHFLSFSDANCKCAVAERGLQCAKMVAITSAASRAADQVTGRAPLPLSGDSSMRILAQRASPRGIPFAERRRQSNPERLAPPESRLQTVQRRRR